MPCQHEHFTPSQFCISFYLLLEKCVCVCERLDSCGNDPFESNKCIHDMTFFIQCYVLGWFVMCVTYWINNILWFCSWRKDHQSFLYRASALALPDAKVTVNQIVGCSRKMSADWQVRASQEKPWWITVIGTVLSKVLKPEGAPVEVRRGAIFPPVSNLNGPFRNSSLWSFTCIPVKITCWA